MLPSGFSFRSNVSSGNEDLSSLLQQSRQFVNSSDSSDHLADLKYSLKDLSSIELYERIEQQHLKHSDLFKLYCHSIAPNSTPSLSISNNNSTTTLIHSRSENSLLSNTISTSNSVYNSLLELVNSNDILFSLVLWTSTQIPLTQRFSKSLKKNFDRVFTCKTFISLLTSQLHKQQMLYFPNINHSGIKSNMDIVEKINSLYKSFSHGNNGQLQSNNSLNFIGEESFSFKQAWSKVQAETFGQFLLEIGIIQNIKPEKKKKFTERSHYYMFNVESILYYAELFFEDKVSSQQQQNVLNQFRNPTFNDSGFTAFSQTVFSPFLTNISAASMHLVSIGQNLQKNSLLNLIVSQEREFEMIQNHIKKTHEEIAQESASVSLDITSPRSGGSPSQLNDATSSAFSLVFRQDHQRSKSRDFTRNAPKMSQQRMSTNLDLSHEHIWNHKDLELKEVIRGKNQHLFETPNLSPRSRFYEENGIKSKIQSIQEALNNPSINEEFTAYCVKDHSEENIIFWKEIQSYRRIQNPNERKERFKYLVSHFISGDSPNSTPVNLESKIVMSFLTLAKENEENISFFSTDVFNELEWLIVNNMKDTFARFNEERNKEIDTQIDELQEKLRLEAIKKEQHSKSFLSQVASAIGRKRTPIVTSAPSNNNQSISKTQEVETKMEMERIPAHEYCTLEAILCNENARKQFRIFCKKEHAEEYILFLDSVDEYKTLTGKLDKRKKALDIFNTFIELPSSGSFLHEEDVRTLDCTKDERENLRKRLDSGDVEMFDSVVISIQNQMLDVYNRFATAQKEWKAKRMLM